MTSDWTGGRVLLDFGLDCVAHVVVVVVVVWSGISLPSRLPSSLVFSHRSTLSLAKLPQFSLNLESKASKYVKTALH